MAFDMETPVQRTKTPAEIYRMPNKPNTDLLPLVAIIMCTWAMVIGQG